ncbi:MAG: hypothetical protein F6K58_10090 [Symploca sp. SIO2E9]|nr:hypothetical protein [Symploca sp. SIO2E9]
MNYSPSAIITLPQVASIQVGLNPNTEYSPLPTPLPIHRSKLLYQAGY